MRIIRRPELRTLAIATTGAAIGIVALCLLLVWRTSNAQQFRDQAQVVRTQSIQNCRAIEQIKTNIRETFMVSLHRALERDNLDAAERSALRQAYDDEITRYAPHECRIP